MTADGKVATARRPEVLLDVFELRKRFGGVQAVGGIDCSVRRGEITGMIGPNGSGKTTTFGMLGGSVRPDGGTIRLAGDDITGRPPFKIVRAGLVRTFQLTRVFADMTVVENLAVGVSGGREQRDMMWELLEMVGLSRLALDYAGSLSFGQQKLLELVRASLLEPQVMLLDEPFAGVNPTMERRLIDFILFGRDQRGMSFFVIDHEMRLMMEICDHIYVMDSGRMICEGPPSVVQNDEATIEAYFGRGHVGGTRAP